MRRITSCAMLLALMMLVSLIAGTASWGGTGKVELRPAGYKLTAPAYVVPVRDGRDTVELIETQAAELSALREYLAAQNASLEQIAREFGALEGIFPGLDAAGSRGSGIFGKNHVAITQLVKGLEQLGADIFCKSRIEIGPGADDDTEAHLFVVLVHCYWFIVLRCCHLISWFTASRQPA